MVRIKLILIGILFIVLIYAIPIPIQDVSMTIPISEAFYSIGRWDCELINFFFYGGLFVTIILILMGILDKPRDEVPLANPEKLIIEI